MRGEWHMQVYVKKHPKAYALTKHLQSLSNRDQLEQITDSLYPKDQPFPEQIAGVSPHFDRRKYPWLSNKEFQTRKPD